MGLLVDVGLNCERFCGQLAHDQWGGGVDAAARATFLTVFGVDFWPILPIFRIFKDFYRFWNANISAVYKRISLKL